MYTGGLPFSLNFCLRKGCAVAMMMLLNQGWFGTRPSNYMEWDPVGGEMVYQQCYNHCIGSQHNLDNHPGFTVQSPCQIAKCTVSIQASLVPRPRPAFRR